MVTFVYRDSERAVEIGYQSSSTAQFLLIGGILIGSAATVLGVVWEYQRYRDEERNAQKKTIVIEQRGLVDTSDTPLSEYVKSNCSWQVDTIVNDIRERIIDNVITRPDLALAKVNNLKISLAEKTAQSAASDISIVYGGVSLFHLHFILVTCLMTKSQITPL